MSAAVLPPAPDDELDVPLLDVEPVVLAVEEPPVPPVPLLDVDPLVPLLDVDSLEPLGPVVEDEEHARGRARRTRQTDVRTGSA